MITTRLEQARRCGFRKPGGFYLIGGANYTHCCNLPLQIIPCKCCGATIQQTRGFQWMNLENTSFNCTRPVYANGLCPFVDGSLTRIGLMWTGKKYYPTVDSFRNEVAARGISKRLNVLPIDLEIGKTWVGLAHPHAIIKFGENGSYDFFPGIFMLFQPTAIEYVTTGQETPERLKEIEAKGIDIIDVVPVNDPQLTLEGLETDGWCSSH